MCEGAQWSDFASQQPLPNLLPVDGFKWLLNGSVLAGQTSQSFTPTAGEVGDTLACEQTVSYPLTPVTVPTPDDVSAAAKSAVVTVVSQNSGPAGAQGAAGTNGSNGSNGSNGADGKEGPAGPAGAKGPAGEIELVTCQTIRKKRRCSTQLISSPQEFTENAALARLSRGGHVYATGSLLAGKLVLRASRKLRAGRYKLELVTGSSLRQTWLALKSGLGTR